METVSKWDRPISYDLGLLLIRLSLASVFIGHGVSKFMNLEGTTAFFSSLGLGAFFVYLVALVETLGGLAMLLGIFTRWAGWLIAINMLAAIFLVKFNAGFLGGWEFDLSLLFSAMAISFAGPGAYTVLRWFGGSIAEMSPKIR